MTSWHGHRNDFDIPDPVSQVWRSKFNRQRAPQMQSNVDLAVLDSSGKVVHWFDGFHHPNPGRRESLVQYTTRELQSGFSRLRLDSVLPRKRPVKLPDLYQSRGIRVLVSLKDNRMKAYQAPVIEVVPLEPEDWKPLAWPDIERTVDASALDKWLSQVYPPGVMERTNPRTKQLYKIKTVQGRLSLVPAGSDGTQRYARASGTIRLTDEGEDDFSFEGQLDIVLTYKPGESTPDSLRGVFEGSYPRYNPRIRKTRWLPLQAAFESRPQ